MASQKRWLVTSDKFLSLDQIDRLKAHLLSQRDLAIARGTDQGIRDHYALLTLLESGLRVFEFVALQNRDFGGQKLVVRNGKGRKPRTVLLTKGTSNLLREWASVKVQLGHSPEPEAPLFPSRYGTTYTTRGMQLRVKLIFKQLGLPVNLSVHSLRHTYCSLLLSSGKVSLATVKENLGHHSIAVTNLYAHAVGDLSGIELYPAPTSEKAEFPEVPTTTSKKKPKNIVEAFLSNVKFEKGSRKNED